MASPRSSMAERAGARVGTILRDKWRLDALLGMGGTASVFAATHRNGKRAAIKILHPELCGHEGLVARFLREGYVANKLEHPGAVSVLDDDHEGNGTVFLVMELLEGYSLDFHARRGAEKLPLERVLRITDAVLDVLAVAHAKGIVHRDIKPANIFLTSDGRVKVLDFGIARLAEPLADGSATQTGAAIGTPAFMPPEQARGRWNVVGPRTDIWAVGATMFALITGERPRRAETVQEELLLAMTSAVPALATVSPGVPVGVAHVVDRAVAFDIEARWPDARAMQAALRGVSDLELSKPSPMTLPITSPQQDTAPVLVAAEGAGPVDVPPTHLTTGRPIMWATPTTTGGVTPPPSRRGLLVATFVGAFVVSIVGIGVALAVVTRGHGHATPQPASTVVAETASPRPPPAAAPAPPAPVAPAAASSTTPAAASASASSIGSPPVKPWSAQPRPVQPSAAPPPSPPPTPPPANTNPYDQRF